MSGFISALRQRIDASVEMSIGTGEFFRDVIGQEQIRGELVLPLLKTCEVWTERVVAHLGKHGVPDPNPDYVRESFWRFLAAHVVANILRFNGGDRDELAVFFIAMLQAPQAPSLGQVGQETSDDFETVH